MSPTSRSTRTPRVRGFARATGRRLLRRQWRRCRMRECRLKCDGGRLRGRSMNFRSRFLRQTFGTFDTLSFSLNADSSS
jgi:hypothetical protein